MQEVEQRMEQLPGECSQQSSNLKGDGYIAGELHRALNAENED